MNRRDRRELGTRERGRLLVALVILAAFDVLFAVALGAAIHGRAEVRDSLAHWQARLEEEDASEEPPARTVGLDAPASRIRRLEEDLESHDERLLLLAVAVVVTTGLVYLGTRALRKGVPVR